MADNLPYTRKQLTMAENSPLLATPTPRVRQPAEEIALGPSKPTVVPLGENAPLTQGEPEVGKSFLGVSFSRMALSRSLMRLRSATMTMSLIERPSDDRRASAFLAGWNVTNLIQGTGILGIPYAVKLGGWAAVVAIVICGYLCCYTGKLLIECLYEDSKRTGQKKRVRVNYPDVGEAFWPGWGNKIVSIVQVCEMSGIAVTYIVLMASIFLDLFHNRTSMNVYEWSVVVGCFVLPGIFITRVSVIAWISMISVFSLFSAVLTIIIYCVTQYDKMSGHNMPGFQLNSFLIGFGIIVFSFTAHAVFPGVEGSMRYPGQYPMMLNVAFANSTITKLILGLMGVFRYGQELNQTITINIKTSPVFYIISNTFVIANVVLAFPLVMFVVLETWDSKMLPHFPHLSKESSFHWFWLILTRPLLLIFGIFLAISVPHFGLVMGLLGSLTGTSLCFIFPCIFHLKLKWKKLNWFQVVCRVFVTLFGIGCGILGAIFSTIELVNASRGNK